MTTFTPKNCLTIIEAIELGLEVKVDVVFSVGECKVPYSFDMLGEERAHANLYFFEKDLVSRVKGSIREIKEQSKIKPSAFEE